MNKIKEILSKLPVDALILFVVFFLVPLIMMILLLSIVS